MLFISYWSIKPGCMKDAVERFLAGGGKPPDGVKLLGRWHKADCSGGWTLTETENPQAAYENAASWSDVIDVYTHPVIEDGPAAAVLARLYKK